MLSKRSVIIEIKLASLASSLVDNVHLHFSQKIISFLKLEDQYLITNLKYISIL